MCMRSCMVNELTEMQKLEPAKTYCVTGATGFIGSWLVKLLLQRGYTVHATVRDSAKSLHLQSLFESTARLKIFKADLGEEGSFDEAIHQCDGVFHVAASMEFTIPETENIDDYVQSNIINPAIKGTLNLLKSCLRAKTVKRVVFTSSISTITAKDNTGEWRPIVDESCQTPVDNVWNMKASGWVYVLMKLLSEKTAFGFAKESGIDLVSVIATTVAGPFLTPDVPSSIQVLLSPLTGDTKFSSILSAVSNRMGSFGLVHIEDICVAHIFVMEKAIAEGQYICCADSLPVSQLVHFLAQDYPRSDSDGFEGETQDFKPCEISSKKLRDLGFTCNYGIKDIISRSITACLDSGFLPPIRKQSTGC